MGLEPLAGSSSERTASMLRMLESMAANHVMISIETMSNRFVFPSRFLNHCRLYKDVYKAFNMILVLGDL